MHILHFTFFPNLITYIRRIHIHTHTHTHFSRKWLSCFHKPTSSWSNSTDLPARSLSILTYPLVVQHAWTPAMNLAAHNNLKCEHEIYDRPPLVSPHKSTIDKDLLARINHAFPTPLWTSPLISNYNISQTKPSSHPCKIICNRPLPLHYCLALLIM